jgi:hypothetical protein
MIQVKQNYEKLNTYSRQIIPALDDYVKSYISYNINPDNEEYARFFSINSGNITTLNKELFVTTNNIQKNTDNLNTEISTLDIDILAEKKIQDTYIFQLQQIEGTGNGAQLMNSNSKETYKTQYIANWNMVIGIFILIGMLITIFKKKISSSSSVPLK